MNPAILETLKLMIGIATSDKTNEATKIDADNIIRRILPIINKDLDDYLRETSRLVQR